MYLGVAQLSECKVWVFDIKFCALKEDLNIDIFEINFDGIRQIKPS